MNVTISMQTEGSAGRASVNPLPDKQGLGGLFASLLAAPAAVTAAEAIKPGNPPKTSGDEPEKGDTSKAEGEDGLLQGAFMPDAPVLPVDVPGSFIVPAIHLQGGKELPVDGKAFPLTAGLRQPQLMPKQPVGEAPSAASTTPASPSAALSPSSPVAPAVMPALSIAALAGKDVANPKLSTATGMMASPPTEPGKPIIREAGQGAAGQADLDRLATMRQSAGSSSAQSVSPTMPNVSQRGDAADRSASDSLPDSHSEVRLPRITVTARLDPSHQGFAAELRLAPSPSHQAAPAPERADLGVQIDRAVAALGAARAEGMERPAQIMLPHDRFGAVALHLSREHDGGIGLDAANLPQDLRIALSESAMRAERQPAHQHHASTAMTAGGGDHQAQLGENTYGGGRKNEPRSPLDDQANRGRDQRSEQHAAQREAAQRGRDRGILA